MFASDRISNLMHIIDIYKKNSTVSSGHHPECRMECYTTEVGPQNSEALIVTSLFFSLYVSVSVKFTTKQWHRHFLFAFRPCKNCFNTNYLSHLALLYKMIVSVATCPLMCIKVLFLKANFLVYTIQKSQPSPTFMFQCIFLFPIKVQLYHIIFWI